MEETAILTRADRYLASDIKNILENGYPDENPRPVYADGAPAHTISVNHVVRKYDLSRGEFPVCTLRPQAWKTGIRELLTIYQRPTNVLSEMRSRGVTWWDPWDVGDGTIGQRYGATVSRYDLVNRLIADIKKDPYGRRKIMDLWQETDLRETPGLMPCAFLTIWNVRGRFLDMCLIQRSGDMLTASGAGGINEIQYAALLMMIARTTEKEPGVFTHFVANEQIYDRHMENARELLRRAQSREKAAAAPSPTGEDPSGSGNRLQALPAGAAGARQPSLILRAAPGRPFGDIAIDDFEMLDYAPMKPQLTFELGI